MEVLGLNTRDPRRGFFRHKINLQNPRVVGPRHERFTQRFLHAPEKLQKARVDLDTHDPRRGFVRRAQDAAANATSLWTSTCRIHAEGSPCNSDELLDLVLSAQRIGFDSSCPAPPSANERRQKTREVTVTKRQCEVGQCARGTFF